MTEASATSWGLYLHIPYCRSKCRYCDFYTRPGHTAVPEAYIDALVRDLRRHRPTGPGGASLAPASVYFGGGTPGLLSAAQVARLLQEAAPLPGAEVTLETNPGLACDFAGWRAAGVNRLSLGVQTARSDSLRTLGRLHTAEDARRALDEARRAGFANISCDIMLALPGYSDEEFDETLQLAQEGGATHISAYLLKIEPGSSFGAKPPSHLPDEDAAAAQYEYANRRLEEAGYARYEISNWAKPGFEGRHNLLYWDCQDYLGLGPAAHSCMKGRRFSFPGDVDAFLADNAPPADEGPLTAADYLMLRLRLEAGFSQSELRRRFGLTLTVQQQTFLRTLKEQGLARPRGEDGWALTTQGLLVQNSILAGLLP